VGLASHDSLSLSLSLALASLAGPPRATFTLGENKNEVVKPNFANNKGRFLRKVTSTPCVLCCRRSWPRSALYSLVRSWRLGARVLLSWSWASSSDVSVWSGSVVAVAGGDGRARINWDNGPSLFFPPAAGVLVHRVSCSSPSPVSLAFPSWRSCPVGAVVFATFLRASKRRLRTQGVVVSISRGALKIRWAHLASCVLPFPPPKGSGLTVVKFDWRPPALRREVVEAQSSATGVAEASAHGLANRAARSFVPTSPAPAGKGLETLVSFNAHSLRKVCRQRELNEWLCMRGCSVGCLQEVKAVIKLESYDVIVGVPDRGGEENYEGKRKSDRNLGLQSDLDCAICLEKGVDYTILCNRSDVQAVVCSLLLIVNVHAPHTGKRAEQRREWWIQFDKDLQEWRSKYPNNLLVIAGDLNANITQGHVLNKRGNKNTALLENVLFSHNLLLANSLFTKQARQLETFVEGKKRTQIDGFLISRRWRSSFKDCRSYAPPTPSDHRPLVLKVARKFRREHEKSSIATAKVDHSTLFKMDRAFDDRLAREIVNPRDWLESACGFAGFQHHTVGAASFTYGDFARAAVTVAKELSEKEARERNTVPDTSSLYLEALAYVAQHSRTPTRSSGTLSQCSQKLWEMVEMNGVQFSCQEAPLQSFLLAAACFTLPAPRAVPSFESSHARQGMRSIRDVYRRHRELLKSHNDDINKELLDLVAELENTRHVDLAKLFREAKAKVKLKSTNEAQLLHWRGINGTKFETPSPIFRVRLTECVVQSGCFSAEEVDCQLLKLKKGKSVGVDGMSAEILCMPCVRPYVLDFCNQYYYGNEVDANLLVTLLARVPKTGDLRSVENYRPVSLVSTMLKLVNLMLLQRLRAIDPSLRETQNGFRQNRGCAEQIVTLQMILDRCDSNILTGTTCCFVDSRNAFPSVSHASLEQALKAWLVPEDVIRVCLQCYKGHRVKVPFDDGTSGFYNVETGVLQGDTLAPYLFVILLDCILDMAMVPADGVPLTPHLQSSRTAGHMQLRSRQVYTSDFITDLAYADDLVLITFTGRAAERQLRAFQTVAEQCGLFINVKKGKTEVYSPTFVPQVRDLHNVKITSVKKYKYLGATPMAPLKSYLHRKSLAWAMIHKFDSLWFSPVVQPWVKLKYFETFVTPTFLYTIESWPSTISFFKTLDGAMAEMLRYCLRPKADSLQEKYLNGSLPLASSSLVYARLRLVGHCLRHDGALSKLLDCSGTLAYKSPKRLTLEKWLRRTIHAEVDEWLEMADNRDSWRSMARRIAADHEQQQYERYYKLCHNRWAQRTDRVHALYHLTHYHSTLFSCRTQPPLEVKLHVVPQRSTSWA